MGERRFILETGSGVSLHKRDMTGAAAKANVLDRRGYSGGY